MTKRRYFVTVMAASRRALRQLADYDLDLFQATANQVQEDRFAIDGLMRVDDVARLVDDGYEVLVRDEESHKARGRKEVVGFDEWLQGMKED